MSIKICDSIEITEDMIKALDDQWFHLRNEHEGKDTTARVELITLLQAIDQVWRENKDPRVRLLRSLRRSNATEWKILAELDAAKAAA